MAKCLMIFVWLKLHMYVLSCKLLSTNYISQKHKIKNICLFDKHKILLNVKFNFIIKVIFCFWIYINWIQSDFIYIFSQNQNLNPNSKIIMDTIFTSPNLPQVFLIVSILGTVLWYYLYWAEERSHQAFAKRGLKYVSLGNLFVDVILKRQTWLKKDAAIKKEGKLFGFRMLGKYTVLLAEPELIQTVVSKEFTNFTNRRVSF